MLGAEHTAAGDAEVAVADRREAVALAQTIVARACRRVVRAVEQESGRALENPAGALDRFEPEAELPGEL
jgi:hypothetical protein